MIKLRIQGTREDVEKFTQNMPKHLKVLEQSTPYANRGTSQYVRVYMDIQPQEPSTFNTEKILDRLKYVANNWHIFKGDYEQGTANGLEIAIAEIEKLKEDI